MIKHLRLLTILLLHFGTQFRSEAQLLPSQASLQLGTPYSAFWQDYTDPVANQLTASLVFRDYNEPFWNVKLKLTIEGARGKFETRPDFRPSTPFILTPGVPYLVQGDAWSEYFNINNMNISGIDRQEFVRSGRLPEGMYTFCIEIQDYNTGKKLSERACASAWIKLIDQPIVVTPQCEQTVGAHEPQNLMMQWQLLNTLSPNSAASTQYTVFLYEVTDLSVNPFVAFNNGKTLPIFESEPINRNALLYDMSRPPLEKGKTYIMRVKASDIEGRDMFKNDGLSEICWFKYGYPEDGIISHRAPENGSGFGKNDDMIFSWSAPDNLSLTGPISYRLQVFEYDGVSDLEMVVKNQMPWHEQNSITTNSRNGWDMVINKKLEAEKKYVWRVLALGGGTQQVAKSEPFVVNGPSLIDAFYAGNHVVKVKSVFNNDLTQLNGLGEMQFTDKGDTIRFEFKNIHIAKVAGRYVLREGEIEIAFPDTFTIALAPRATENLNARYYPEKMRLTTQALEMRGLVKWPLPHPVTARERAFVTSTTDWVNYDRYKVFGVINLTESNQFDLLEPLGFRLELASTSTFQLINNDYELRLDGTLYLPSDIKSVNGERISFDFQQRTNLHYFDQSNVKLSSPILLVEKTKLTLEPQNITIDFSEERSPLKLGDNKRWKGVHFDRFTIHLPEDTDPTGQLSFSDAIAVSIELNPANEFKAWANEDGLTAYVFGDFPDQLGVYFNKFGAKLNKYSFDIEHNAVTDSYIKGEIAIPVIDKFQQFSFTMPLSAGGFETGYLDEDLTERSFVFSPYGGENRVDLIIRQAVFAEKERLDLTVDIEIPVMNTKMLAVKDFRVYGDHYIGFQKRNGSIHLEEHAEGAYEGFTVYIDKIGAALDEGDYTFSYSATMPLGEEVAGESGPPRIDIFSTEPAGEEAKASASAAQVAQPDMPKPELPKADPRDLSIDSMGVRVTSSIVEFEGRLMLTKGHPVWGTSLQGGINGEIKMPSRIAAGANLILGTKDKLKYWYFDAFFVDEGGMGIKVFNMFNIVGFEGRIYRHMRQNAIGASDSKAPDMSIDGDVEFGAALYMQLIDPAGGFKVKSDVGIELLVEREHFTVQMEGDVSLVNVKTRSAGALSALKKEAAKEMAKEAASQVLNQIDNIDITLPVGGGHELGIKASKSNGAFSYNYGGGNVSLIGDVSNVPKAQLIYTHGDNQINLSGSVQGEASIQLKKGQDHLKIGYSPIGSAEFDFSYDNYGLLASYNHQRKIGAFNFTHLDNKIDLGVNADEGKGHVTVQISPTQRFSASAESAGKGEFEMRYDNVYTRLMADKQRMAGSLEVEVGNEYFRSALDKTAGNGSLSFSLGGVSYDLFADRSGVGNMLFTQGNNTIGLEVDKPNGKGSIVLGVGQNKLDAMLDKEGMASMNLTTGNTSIGISTDKTAGAGGFRFKQGDTNIDVQANRSAGTGKIDLAIGGEKVFAEITPDNKSIRFDISGTLLAASLKNNEEGELTLNTQGNLLRVGANKNEGSGFLEWDANEGRIFAEANKSAGTGKLEIGIGEVQINAGIESARRYLNFDINNTLFEAEATDNSGYISFAKDATALKAGLETDRTGFLSFRSGATNFDIRANKEQRSGSVRFAQGQDSVVAIMNSEIKRVGFSIGNTAMNAHLSADNKGGLFVKHDNKSITVEGGSQEGYLKLADGNNFFEIEANKASGSGALRFDWNPLAIDASITSSERKLNVKYTDFSFDAFADQTSGRIGITKGQTAFALGLGDGGQNGYFSLEHEGNKISIDANRSTGDGNALLDWDNINASASLSNNKKTISFDLPGYHFSAFNENNDGGLAFKAGENAIAIGKIGSLHQFSWKSNNNGIRAAVDPSTRVGLLGVKWGSDSILADITSTSQKLTLVTGAVQAIAENNDGVGSFDFNYEQTSIGLGLDRTNKEGYVRLKQGNDAFELHKKATESSINGKWDNNEIAALYSSDNKSINLAVENRKIGLSLQNTTGTFDFADANAALSLSANPTTKTANVSFSLSPVSISGNVNATNKTAALAFETGGYNASVDASNTKKSFALAAQGYQIKADYSSANQYAMSIAQSENRSLWVNNTQNLEMGIQEGNLSIALNTASVVTFSYGSDQFVVDFSNPQFSLKKNNVDQETELSNKAQGSISMKEYTNGALDLTIIKNSTETLFEYGTAWTIQAKKDGSKTINYKGTNANVTAEYAAQKATFSVNDYVLSADKATNSIAFSDGTHAISLSTTQAIINRPPYRFEWVNNEKLSFTDGNAFASFTQTGLEAGYGDYQLGYASSNAWMQMADNKKISISNEALKIQYNDVALEATTNNTAYYKDPNREISISTAELAWKEGNNRLSIKDDKSLSFTNNDVSLSLSTQALALAYGSHKLELSSEKTFQYSDNQRSIDLSTDNIKVVEQEHEVEWSSGKFIAYKGGTDKRIRVDAEGATVAVAEHTVSFGANKSLSYEGNGRNYSINTEEVNIKEGEYELALTKQLVLSLKAGTDKSLTLSKEGLNFAYADASMSFSKEKALSYSDNQYAFDLSKDGLELSDGDRMVAVRSDKSLELRDGTSKSITINTSEVAVSYEGRNIRFGSEKALLYEDADRKFDFSTDGVSIQEGEYLLSLSADRKFILQAGTGKRVEISEAGLELNYDRVAVGFSTQKALYYSDGTYRFDLGEEGLAIGDGQRSLALGADKSLTLIDGERRKLEINTSGANLQYDQVKVAFGTNKSLSFSDGQRSFDLSTAGLEMSYDDYLMKILNQGGTPAIALKKANYEFTYSDGSALVKDGTHTLLIGGEQYFKLNFGNKEILASSELLHYKEGNRLIAFGGANFIELKEGNRGVSFSKDKELKLIDDTRTFTVSPTYASYNEGNHTFMIGGDNLVAYSDGTQEISVYDKGNREFGVGYSRGEYKVGLSAGANKAATLSLESGFGNVSVSGDTRGNFTAAYGKADQNISVSAGRDGLSFTGFEIEGMGGAIADEPEYLEGSAQAPEMGPRYLGEKITKDDGAARGKISLYFNSKEQHLIANAAVKSIIPPCVEAAMGLEATPNTWRVDVGTEHQRISIYPSCSGFGGGGWFGLTPTKVNVGVFGGFRAGGDVKFDVGVGWARVYALIEAELGARAEAQIQPEFKIERVGVWVRLYAGIGVEYSIAGASGDFKVAEAELKGTLDLYFEDRTRITGTLEGKVTVVGISAGFDMGFDKTL